MSYTSYPHHHMQTVVDTSDDDSEMGDWVDVIHSDDEGAPVADAVKVTLLSFVYVWGTTS